MVDTVRVKKMKAYSLDVKRQFFITMQNILHNSQNLSQAEMANN